MCQALQDYVEIIEWVMHEFGLPQDIPIITFGGSYPGELAAFLRIAFPNVRIHTSKSFCVSVQLMSFFLFSNSLGC